MQGPQNRHMARLADPSIPEPGTLTDTLQMFNQGQ